MIKIILITPYYLNGFSRFLLFLVGCMNLPMLLNVIFMLLEILQLN